MIRRARLSDREALAALWQEVDELHAELAPGYFRFPDSGRLDEPRLLKLRQAIGSGDEALLVADGTGGQLAGFVHVQLYDAPPLPTVQPARRAHVDDVVVARARRRAGCGRALMAAAAAWARKKGASQLVLTVWSGNRDAEQFYRALGYGLISQELGLDL